MSGALAECTHAVIDWINPLFGLAGVLVGGLITYFTTHRFENRRLLREKKALAYRAIFDVARAADDLTKLAEHAEKARASSSDVRNRGMALAGIRGFRRDMIKFDAETLGLIADMKEPELVQSMIELENGHQIAMDSFFKLVELRDRIGHSGIAVAHGSGLSFDLSTAAAQTILPAIMEMESLTSNIEPMLPRLATTASALRSKLGPALKFHYGFEHFVTIAPRG